MITGGEENIWTKRYEVTEGRSLCNEFRSL